MMAAALGKSIAPEVDRRVSRRRHPALLRRHHAWRSSVLGYRPAVTLEDGLVGARRVAAAIRRPRTASPRPAASWRREGWRDDAAAAVPPSGGLVLITGGAGFVATNVADRLLRDGRRVRIFDNLSRAGVEQNVALAARAARRPRVELQVGDVRDARRGARRPSRGVDRVFHFAAQVAVTTSLIDPFARLRRQRPRHAQRARGDARRWRAGRACSSRPPTRSTAHLDDVPLRPTAAATSRRIATIAAARHRRGRGRSTSTARTAARRARPISTCSTTRAPSDCRRSCSA